MKNEIISHNATNNTIVLVYKNDGKFHTKQIPSTHPNWGDVCAAYNKSDFEKVIALSDIESAINAKFSGSFTISNGKVMYRGNPVNGYLFDRIMFFMNNRIDCTRLVRFAENLYKNPSNRSREELYRFLEHKNMPITDDGCFTAYKGVQNDFWSKTGGSITVLKGKVNDQGQIYNGVGEEVVVDRGDVDDNCANTCSKGIHAGSFEYAKSFAGDDGKIVIVKINPADCVSVPNDCDGKKLRTCRYEVIGEEYRALSDIKDINYDKGEVFTPEPVAQVEEVESCDCEHCSNCDDSEEPNEFENGYTEGWVEGVACAEIDYKNSTIGDHADPNIGSDAGTEWGDGYEEAFDKSYFVRLNELVKSKPNPQKDGINPPRDKQGRFTFKK